MKKLCYHFSLFIEFKKNIDVNEIANRYKVKPHKITTYEKSVSPVPSAKLWYKSKDLSDFDVGEQFYQFLLFIKENFSDLKQVLAENNGGANADIIIEEMPEYPAIYFTKETIELLSELGLEVDTDCYE